MFTILVPGTKPLERFRVYGVQADEIDEIWPLVVEGIRLGMPDSVDPEKVRERVRDKVQQLWMVTDDRDLRVIGVVVSEIVNYDRVKALCIVSLWGVLTPMWMWTAKTKFEEFARGNGCTRVEALSKGRVLEVLKHWGFRGEQTFVTMEI